MVPTQTQEHWFCVRAKVGFENRAVEALSRISPEDQSSVGSFELYYPRIRRMMPVCGKRRLVTAPLFPGYFFARFNCGLAGRFVSSRPGVLGLVRTGQYPTIVPAQVIDDLKGLGFADEPEFFPSPIEFTPGQRLVITDGPFAGMEAEFVSSLNGGQRALLLLDYLQSRVSLMADTAFLEPAD